MKRKTLENRRPLVKELGERRFSRRTTREMAACESSFADVTLDGRATETNCTWSLYKIKWNLSPLVPDAYAKQVLFPSSSVRRW